MSAPQPSESPDLSLSVSCDRFDFQVSAIAQICSDLFGSSSSTGATLLFPVIEELMVGFHPGEASEQERRDEDAVDRALWRALLTSFQHTHMLCVHTALAADLASALRPANEETVVGEEPEPDLLLLPELRTVMLLHGDDESVLATASEALSVFVDGRKRARRPVNVEPRDLSRLSSWPLRPAISSSLRLGTKRTRRVPARVGGVKDGRH
jgi:hypothetical protein